MNIYKKENNLVIYYSRKNIMIRWFKWGELEKINLKYHKEKILTWIKYSPNLTLRLNIWKRMLKIISYKLYLMWKNSYYNNFIKQMLLKWNKLIKEE